MEEEIPRKYSIAQKRALFFRFVEFNDPHFNDELKAKVRTLAINLSRRDLKFPSTILQTTFGIAIQVMVVGGLADHTRKKLPVFGLWEVSKSKNSNKERIEICKV